jgi:hypothetical protein
VKVTWQEWIREAESPARVAEKPEALDGLLVLDCAVTSWAGSSASSARKW